MKTAKIKKIPGELHGTGDVYVLSGPTGTVLVDPCFYDARLGSFLSECGGLDAVLVTHSHWDQIAGLEELLRNHPRAQVYHHVLDEGFPGSGELNGSGSHTCRARMNALVGGMHLIGGYKVLAVHTPGHTVGSCTYVFPEEKAAFVGDSLALIGEVDTAAPTGCRVCQHETMDKLRSVLSRAGGQVFSAHTGSAAAERVLECCFR